MQSMLLVGMSGCSQVRTCSSNADGLRSSAIAFLNSDSWDEPTGIRLSLTTRQ